MLPDVSKFFRAGGGLITAATLRLQVINILILNIQENIGSDNHLGAQMLLMCYIVLVNFRRS